MKHGSVILLACAFLAVSNASAQNKTVPAAKPTEAKMACGAGNEQNKGCAKPTTCQCIKAPCNCAGTQDMPPSSDAAMLPPSPAPELDAVGKTMIGTWTCKGEAAESPFGAAHPFIGSLKIARELDGHWYAGYYNEKKSKDNPKPMAGRDMITYDAQAKIFRRAMFDNMGGLAHLSSKGWEGSAMVWTGDMMVAGHKTPVRNTLSKKTDREIDDKYEIQIKGRWFELNHSTCKK